MSPMERDQEIDRVIAAGDECFERLKRNKKNSKYRLDRKTVAAMKVLSEEEVD